MVFDEKIWEEFEQKARKQFPKTYAHFDLPINLDRALPQLKKLLQNSGVAIHSFLPFVKMVLKKPRYRFDPEKGEYALSTKERPISYAGHFDALIFSYFDLLLKRRYQTFVSKQSFSACVLSYRDDLNGKCNIQFAKEIFDNIKEGQTAIAFDIKGYFDSIPHKGLKKHWQTVIGQTKMDSDTFAVYKALTVYSYAISNSLKSHFNFERPGRGQSLLHFIPGRGANEKYSYLRNKNLIATNEATKLLPPDHPLAEDQISIGIPQGSAISATLSNVYLLEFDQHMHNSCQQLGATYRRYCDDLIIVCKTKDKAYFKNRLETQIELHGLTIQDKKTEVIDFKRIDDKLRAYDGRKGAEKYKFKNLQYLGFDFNGNNVYIRPGSLSAYFRKMKAGIRNNLLKVYGKNSDRQKILIKGILEKYSHLGKNNFIAYAYRAASKTYGRGASLKEGMNSSAITKQISRHFNILLKEISTENEQRYALKQREISHKLKKGIKTKSLIKKSRSVSI